MKKNNLNLISRIQEPTPKWFKIIRSAGLVLSAVGGALIAAPIALPTALVTVGGYLLLGGTLATAISQTAIKAEEQGDQSEKLPEKSDEAGEK